MFYVCMCLYIIIFIRGPLLTLQSDWHSIYDDTIYYTVVTILIVSIYIRG
jgi:hypothetical protein